MYIDINLQVNAAMRVFESRIVVENIGYVVFHERIDLRIAVLKVYNDVVST